MTAEDLMLSSMNEQHVAMVYHSYSVATNMLRVYGS